MQLFQKDVGISLPKYQMEKEDLYKTTKEGCNFKQILTGNIDESTHMTSTITLLVPL
jgi:hypothetical protein